MGTLDTFVKKEKLIQRTVNIDDKLFDKLEMLALEFNDCSVSKIINASITDFASQNRETIEIGNIGPTSKHSVAFRESVLESLSKMAKKYSSFKYVVMNVAIREGIEVLEKKIEDE